jgi:hypothetical protein
LRTESSTTRAPTSSSGSRAASTGGASSGVLGRWETRSSQVFLDDVPILLQQYTREYAPKEHRIELGVEERRESIVGAVYSNVRIGRR